MVQEMIALSIELRIVIVLDLLLAVQTPHSESERAEARKCRLAATVDSRTCL
jgi:hypothetical protein